MAFWGVELKPGRPFVHNFEQERGRLHVSQATLGNGSTNKKCIVQCKVGDKEPIYVCSFLPEKLETCPLNLEFEEDEDVTFSVIGSHSVHLSGFFYGESEDCCGNGSDDYEGAGSDSDDPIEFEYDTEDEDEDGSSDDDFSMYPPSPIPNSGVKIEEILEDEKPTDENGTSKKSKKKKNQSNGTDEGNTDSALLESEDEDGFPISAPRESKTKSVRSKKSDGTEDQDTEEEAINEKARDNVDERKGLKKRVRDDTSKANDQRVTEKKKKKKKNKKNQQDDKAAVTEQDKKNESQEVEENKPSHVRSFGNGLVIEDLAMGKPDGKRASPGKKIGVRYIGKLKKNGKIFDSNIGKRPFEFRLGIGEVIKGWDVGVNGMRIGDKRRITIPPAMGYGTKGAGRDIPPNSWLVFDVELVNVN
ncbi:peptidyl-prolyl cis-trans isomerase FKBP53 isoform X2 [Lycium ferocissimum]|uniref:peptidyl-prolyl cis-trans isomerase FKBP53 isoform X2 n=1 Tax=Lycium ferocissimum TaxID=112874 RepID=UPI002814DF31|nr:peptidyl-prolyl cis-trans isomerase FKBP53 isoform X2 [Lycium ferocissimum]